jgi:hypothetical protein
MKSPSVSFRFALLGIAALLAIAAWCAYWLHVSRQAQARAAALESELRQDGLTIDCGDRSWGGFPFRIAMRCRPFGISTKAANSSSLILARADFLAQAYDPGHVIVVASSPGELHMLGGSRVEIGFTRAVASYVAGAGGETSAAIDALATRGLAVDQMTLHLKRSTPKAPRLDFALAASNVSLDIPGYGDEKVDRLSLQGALETPVRLAWEPEGSALGIQRLEIASGEVLAAGNGRIGFDQSARLEGRIVLDVTDLRQLLDRLADRGVVDREELAAGLALLTLLGEGAGSATRIDLRSEEGRLYFGPFRLGEVPPAR